jgi:hypothetical protein
MYFSLSSYVGIIFISLASLWLFYKDKVLCCKFLHNKHILKIRKKRYNMLDNVCTYYVLGNNIE